PGLGWETTKSLNIGLDYGLFKSRITGEINVYKNNTEDLLLKRAISGVHGIDYVFQNIGKTQNEGLEFLINSNNISSPNFKWSTNLNLTLIKTEIKALYGDGQDDIANKWFLGQNINVNYDYKFTGVWQENEADLAAQYGALPGYAKFEDLNDNGEYDPGDRQIIGSPDPNFTWGLTNNFNYKNFGLYIFAYGKEGIVKANPYKERNYLIAHPYWTPDNPTNEYWGYDSNSNRYVGSRGSYPSVYENADFIRLKEITLSYSLPQSLDEKIKIKNAKIYLTGKNLATITNWSALDPELDNQRAIPLEREFLLGLDLSF
ncbi:MAG: SusC/RagA family TonB-linked outer membrane protein, partial [Gillisia sp.]